MVVNDRIACLLVHPVSACPVHAQRRALVDVARAFSPRVRAESDGEVLLAIDGLERAWPDERRLGNALLNAARRASIPVRVGIASGVFTARLAATTVAADTLQLVEPGAERDFLEPLPISSLVASPRVLHALRRFGVERLGQLAGLPAKGLGLRLGSEGLRLWRQARGEDVRRLVADPVEERFVEGDVLDGVVRLQPLLYQLGLTLQRLSERLAGRGLTAAHLWLGLQLESGRRQEREIEMAVPSREVGVWSSLIRLNLTEAPPAEPVEALWVEAEPVSLRPAQVDLLARDGPPPALVDDLLERLSAMVGPKRMGTPRVCDSHWPDRFRLLPFGSRERAKFGAGTDGSPGPLRAVRPPASVAVQTDSRGRLLSVRGRWLTGRVRQVAGPWRLNTAWWERAPLVRDYYDVALSDGGLYRLYWDGLSRDWFVDGTYG